MDEVDEKTDRLARLAHSVGLGGILLNTQANFSWLTGGRSNRVDGSREGGSGSLLVSARGERYVVANNIEMPRLTEEALAGLGFTPCEYAWTEEHGNPRRPIEVARDVLRGGLVGSDGALSSDKPLDSQITATRALLTDAELPRYRTLGRDIGCAVGETCRTLVAGLEETEIAKRVAVAVACVGARAIVTLVAADERIARYRHPLPTNARWRHTVLVAVCAQRDGLVVALSRIVTRGEPCSALEARTVATAGVFERLLAATRPEATGAELFSVATKAYAEADYAGEEALHHQGGAIGYRSRDWVAHPRSRDRVQRQQAFAWNPSITGTKIEDTVLVTPDGIENLTASPDWPQIPLRCNGLNMSAAGLLAL
jgi:Xaa-Pro aminopeptidase